MKTAQSLFWLLFSSLSLCCHAATLIVPGEQPALTIPANEAILIDFYQPSSFPSYIQIVSQGVTNSVPHFSPTPEQPLVLAGPLTIVFPPNSSTPEGQTTGPNVVNYRPLGKAGISTLVLRAGATNTIEVSSNKTIHFFPTALIPQFYALFEKGTNCAFINASTDVFGALSNSEFTGPIKISLLTEIEDALVSYQLVEDFSMLPDFGAVQVPAGNSVFTIEKSLNLTNWQPVFLHQRTADEKSFYRFKVSR